MKIVWATDFSPRSRGAGQVAAELARLTAGAIEVVHVVGPHAADLLALGADAGLIGRDLQREAETLVVAEAHALEAGGVPASAWLGEGAVEAQLLEHAADVVADLIVMGGHARGALGRLMLGSNADRTIRRADRPILIVPEGVVSLQPEAGTLRVVVALDGQTAGPAVLETVRSLRRQTPCDVTFLRLYWPPEEYGRLGLQGARDFLTSDPEIVTDLQRHLANQIGALPGQGRTSIAVEASWGDPARRILEIARERQAGVLVLGAESRRGLGRLLHTPVADRVARQASGLPVLFVPPTPAATTPADAGLPVLLTVLAATDLSAAGNRAVPFAYSLLAGRGGVVELCHVHERPLPSPPYAYDTATGKLTAPERAELERRLRALIPREAEALGIATHVDVVDGGSPAVALVQAAERLWADAVVVGTHGRGGASRTLLGSVSDEVVRHCGRPVFVVPPPGQDR